MPTELKLSKVIENFSVKDYYRVVYGDATGFQKFHREITKDPNASITDWKNGQREVSFRMALNVPAMFKKVIGADTIGVVETQRITWHGSSSFTVVSEPTLNFAAANKFTTKGQVTVSAGPGGSCQVECLMTCIAGLPWPMQSTAEAAMAQEAKDSVGNFLEYCKQICEEDRNNRAGAAAAAGPAGRRTAAAAGGEQEGEDVFFDAEDEREAGWDAGQDTASATSRAIVPSEPVTLEQAVLMALQQIQHNSAESVKLLQQMQACLERMDGNIGAVRSVVAPGRKASSAAGKARSGYTWSVVLLFGAAAASTAGVVYLRSKQRGGLSTPWWSSSS
eukprot:CAMPEP_0202899100 /NCGR_PEP_ID=MMETSP1392-20130828/7428_1 /ASSEMBLY_ACC=CAM_ASM_000868 /TAXON_ID=225041 /ORGANISM="Chlamydomonas chlamydogama, Strain SAG 11-48b" /LENGTH=333 /DNA_ID=CAMNT_0049585199 /DNA_START=111 /DNA_END=1115 /DNA_ORIENTATION=+